MSPAAIVHSLYGDKVMKRLIKIILVMWYVCKRITINLLVMCMQINFVLINQLWIYCIPRTKVGGYYGSASVTPRPPPPRPPQTLSCVHSTGHKYEPIHFIFGMGIGYGKISAEFVFGAFSDIQDGRQWPFCKKINTFLCALYRSQIWTDCFHVWYGHWLW